MSAKDSRIWARLDVDFADNVKVAVLSDAAFRALVEMILWSRRALTDGVVPARVAEQRWGRKTDSVSQSLTESATDPLTELCSNDPEAPSLSRNERGDYVIHDYLEHQESAADVKARLARNSANGRKGGRPRKTDSVSQSVAERGTQSGAQKKAETETETEISKTLTRLTAREDAPKPKRRSPSVPIPDDWQPTQAHADRARQLGVNLDREAEAFRAHAQAHDRRCVRWDAAFTQWLLKARDHSQARGPDTPDLVITQPTTPEEQAALTAALFTPQALQDILAEEATRP